MNNNSTNSEQSQHMTNFTRFPNELFGELNGNETILWLAIFSVAREHGECWLSNAQLAEMCSCSVSTIIRTRKSLVAKGKIIANLRYHDDDSVDMVWHCSIPNDVLFSPHVEPPCQIDTPPHVNLTYEEDIYKEDKNEFFSSFSLQSREQDILTRRVDHRRLGEYIALYGEDRLRKVIDSFSDKTLLGKLQHFVNCVNSNNDNIFDYLILRLPNPPSLVWVNGEEIPYTQDMNIQPGL